MANNKLMRAIKYDSYGGGVGLKHVEVPNPKAGKGDLLLKVEATSINPVDWKIHIAIGRYKQVDNNLLPATATFTMNSGRGSSNPKNAPGIVSESLKSNDESTYITAISGGLTSITVSGPTSSQTLQT